MDLFGKKKIKKLNESVVNLTKVCGEVVEERNELLKEVNALRDDVKFLRTMADFFSDYDDTHGLIFPDTLKLDLEEFKKFKEKMTAFLEKFDNHIHFLPGQKSYCLCSTDGKYVVFKKQLAEDDEYPGYLLRFSFFDKCTPNALPTYSMTFFWDSEPNTQTDDKEIMEYFNTLIKYLDECIECCEQSEDKPVKKSKKNSKKNKTKKKK